MDTPQQLSYLDLPYDIRCLTLSTVTRWNHIRQFLNIHPTAVEVYNCVTKIEPDEDITNPDKWMTLDELAKFKNLESMTNPLYIFRSAGTNYLLQFSKILRQLVKLRELVLILDLDTIMNPKDRYETIAKLPSATGLLIQLISEFFLHEFRRSRGKLTILVNHELINLINLHDPRINRTSLINNGNLTYEDLIYLLHHNHLYWELDMEIGLYYGEVKRVRTIQKNPSIPYPYKLVPSINGYTPATLYNIIYRQIKLYGSIVFGGQRRYSNLLYYYQEYRRGDPSIVETGLRANNILKYTTTPSLDTIQQIVVNNLPIFSTNYREFYPKIQRDLGDYLSFSLRQLPNIISVISSNPPFSKLSVNFSQTAQSITTSSKFLISHYTDRFDHQIHFDYLVEASSENINNLMIRFKNLKSTYLYYPHPHSESISESSDISDILNIISTLLELPNFEYVVIFLHSREIAFLINQNYYGDSRVQIRVI